MADWENTLVTPEATIVTVIEVISKGNSQIALVVDQQRRLIGTITDGDIRRGLLQGKTLESSVDGIMNSQFIHVTPEESRQSAFQLMRQKSIHQVPIIDAENRVRGLYLLDELLDLKKFSNPVLLMAGGLGTRLRPLTNDTPKPMLKVGGRPILELILERFISDGFENFYISVNYLADIIMDYFGDGHQWGAKIKYIEENKKMGTAGAISLITDTLRESLIVANGDVLTKVDYVNLLKFHRENNSIATMCVRPYQVRIPFGVVKIEDNKINQFEEKPILDYHVNAGIYVIEPRLIKYMPNEIAIDMPDLLQMAQQKNESVCAFPIHEYWLDLGHHKEFDQANAEYFSTFVEA